MSVVVPFRGGVEDAEAMLGGLRTLELGEGDEVIIVDNGGDGVAKGAVGCFRLLRADGERSSHHARNAGAAVARNEWILFVDADCSPRRDLLVAYFAGPVSDDCGALAGQIRGDPGQVSLSARYARSRRFFDHAQGLIRAEEGGAGAGNLLVRRSAFVELGGFAGLAVAAREAAAHVVRGDLESASFRAIDCLGLIAHNLGYMSPNSARRLRSGCW